MRAKSPTSGRFSASSIRLPTYRAATKAQKMSAAFVKSAGPASTPCIRSPASMMAEADENGIPSAGKGKSKPTPGALPLRGGGEGGRGGGRGPGPEPHEEAEHGAPERGADRAALLLAVREEA